MKYLSSSQEKFPDAIPLIGMYVEGGYIGGHECIALDNIQLLTF